MKKSTCVFLIAAFLLCGCASTMQSGFGARRQRRNDPTLIPEAKPDLGSPIPTLPPSENSKGAEGSSSQKIPSISPGPILEAPEASRRLPSGPSHPLAQESRTTRFRHASSGNPNPALGRPALLDEPTWSRAHHSTGHRPIESLVIGDGTRRIAVLASLHGDESQSVAIVEQLARHLNRRAGEFQDVRVLIVHIPNPDGQFGRSPYNSRGVDLNRNFPSANWKRLASNRSGDRAASEIETRVVVRLLTDFWPDLLIHVKDARGAHAGSINVEGAAEAYAAAAAKQNSYRIVKNLGKATSGSLENYALTQLHCPSLTLLLPREKSDEAAWGKNSETILAPLRQYEPPSQDDLLGAADPFEQSAPAALSGRGTILSTEPRRLPETNNVGYRAKLPDFPAPIPEHGYLELPPP